jgi:Na+/proline symporter
MIIARICMTLNAIDLAIFAFYVIGLMGVAYYVPCEKSRSCKNTDDYFLAEHSSPWWAIGASLIAAIYALFDAGIRVPEDVSV